MDMGELERELGRVRSRLDSWATRRSQEAAEAVDTHIHSMSDQKGKLAPACMPARWPMQLTQP